jgi:hypothetical protein
MDPAPQTELFNRRSGGPTVTRGQGFQLFISTTWMLRERIAADFKVRLACPNKVFKYRLTWNARDEDGDSLSWVFEYPRGTDGKLLKDSQGHIKRVHTLDADNKRVTRKYGEGGTYIRMYEPKVPTFPSHTFPSIDDNYIVTGDDGSTWKVGSRGNDPAVIRQEILNNPILWPEEKVELMAWVDGDRKLPGRDDDDPLDLHRIVDGYFCDQIQQYLPVTEQEISASGLPQATVENLIHNLRNYREAHDG